MKNKTKASLGERLCNALDIGAELLPKKTLVEIHGSSLVKIQGAGNILLYTDTEIRIALIGHRDALCVKGNGLSCSSYNKGVVGITGLITSVSFLREDNNV